MPNDPYYFTPKHRRWRAAVLRRAKYLCVECARYGKPMSASHAHHIKPRKEYPELQYSLDNGQALCTACHNKIETRIGGKEKAGGR